MATTDNSAERLRVEKAVKEHLDNIADQDVRNAFKDRLAQAVGLDVGAITFLLKSFPLQTYLYPRIEKALAEIIAKDAAQKSASVMAEKEVVLPPAAAPALQPVVEPIADIRLEPKTKSGPATETVVANDAPPALPETSHNDPQEAAKPENEMSPPTDAPAPLADGTPSSDNTPARRHKPKGALRSDIYAPKKEPSAPASEKPEKPKKKAPVRPKLSPEERREIREAARRYVDHSVSEIWLEFRLSTPGLRDVIERIMSDEDSHNKSQFKDDVFYKMQEAITKIPDRIDSAKKSYENQKKKDDFFRS